ncbi:hypothetical protein [Ruania halotolerans]|uniref:hypothetical protein n=1 Tax=Ruania halotolerans TaxID=2897773 RepID=UPI001E51B389|nr:hypothetical protein [Ruania halotolerans]UFU07679.1 hypothetical protein LQF10_06135 [Ruania halotolerans]
MSRRFRIAAIPALLAAAGMLGACAIEVPETPEPPEQTETLPALDGPRLERVLADLGDLIAAADEEQDADLLADRVQDPALSIRAAEYALAAATADSDEPYTPQPLTAQTQVEIVAVTDTWPRTVMVVTEIPDESNVPLLVTLEQETPRSQYQMHSWVRLLPGVQMPETAVPSVGSAPVPLDAEGYLYTPPDALDAYARLLGDRDDEGTIEDTFAEDPFRTLVTEQLATFDFDEAGEFDHNTTAAEEDILTLATADGGYIAVGAMNTRYTFTKTVDGAELSLGGQIAALDEEDGEVSEDGESLNARYELMVAVYVPVESDDAQAMVIGAERVLSGVSHDSPDE